ncbi:MAG: hypothetical protein HON53_14240 [Planctomycetaceae bacterium]|jgi:hypothetical protein|nr:hypothetical protein [Planctomycetaceae bacterium]MBT6156114.1 hypothetical protein [Planctomycetaceae bacterium]MBT6485152.1 hypothetical protein [Planctomycetaceae bacterium]MBT6497570.1 hypothetical protein [Planctomycetaceae bacterium]
MDDALTAKPLQQTPRETDSRQATRWPSRSRCLFALAVTGLAVGLTGCSLFVMAGKLLYGDPKITSAFGGSTGIDLVEDEKTVLVIYTTPESVKSEFASVEFDLTEETIRRLRRHEIKVIKSDDVATFIDDNGGFWEDESELAQHFDADIIVHVDLDTFTCTEENSPWMLRGRAEGTLYAYRVGKVGDDKVAQEVFVREFTSTHPRQSPVSSESISRTAFQKRYVDLMAQQVAQMLCSHRASELIQ